MIKMATMVQHHVHYKEIDGYDEIVMMEKGEHIALHDRLRYERKCNIPVKKLRKISNAARSRMLNKNKKQFYSTPGRNTQLYEAIHYNPVTFEISVYSSFHGTHNFIVPRIDIE